jgi:hypothetical protein
VLGHLDTNNDLRDLMSDRIPVTPLTLIERPAAPLARRRPVLDHTIRISDKLPVAAVTTGLPTLLLPRRPLLPRPLPARLWRVARRRQAAVVRAAADQPLQLLDLALQHSDPLGLRRDHTNNNINAGRVQALDLVPPHERKIPCTQQESCPISRRPRERLRPERPSQADVHRPTREKD